MSSRQLHWTRRQFAQAIAASAAASSFVVRGATALTPSAPRGFAFVGRSDAAPLSGSIQVYRTSGSEWKPMHAVAAASPANLLLHPTLPVLYVVHNVAVWDDLPRGAVSAYSFDAATGRLALRSTQPLSLSATNPRHAVLSKAGSGLLVSAQTGGIYNLLSIAADGNFAGIRDIRKEFGLQVGDAAKIAAPGPMVQAADGSIYAVDPGQETVTRFDVQPGGLTVRHRTRVHAGAGPSGICMSQCEERAYVLNAADGSLSTHDVHAGGLSEARDSHTLGAASASLLMHPGGRFMIAADAASLRVLRVGRQSLSLHSSSAQPSLASLSFADDGMQMIGVESASGRVVSRSFDPVTGAVGGSRVVAEQDGAISLLMMPF